MRVDTLTPGSLVDLVLDEEVGHRHNGGKESKLCYELTITFESG